VDCHLHTFASGDSVLTLEQLAERARQTALDVVCVTDHNVTSAAVTATEEVPDFDGPAGFLAALADARVAGEFRDHAPRYPRRPPAGT